VRRDFTADAQNRLWLADITYLDTDEGWRYLAVILDAFSRRIVGWALADHLGTELPLQALDMALRDRQVRPGQTLMHHTDSGSQGGFKRSSQHLEVRSCDGKTPGLGSDGDRATADAVAGPSVGRAA
jgi:transposase InsO family protein